MNVWVGVLLIGTGVSSLPRLARIVHLSVHRFDDVPILLDIEGENISCPRRFRFEVMWTLDDTSREVVEGTWHGWTTGSARFRVARKLRQTKEALKQWNKHNFGNVRGKAKSLREALQYIRSTLLTMENIQLEENLCHALEHEEQKKFMH